MLNAEPGFWTSIKHLTTSLKVGQATSWIREPVLENTENEAYYFSENCGTYALNHVSGIIHQASNVYVGGTALGMKPPLMPPRYIIHQDAGGGVLAQTPEFKQNLELMINKS